MEISAVLKDYILIIR